MNKIQIEKQVSLPRHPDWIWCRDLLDNMGADVSQVNSKFCWLHFYETFPQYLEPFKWIIEAEQDPNIRIMYVYMLNRYCGADDIWANNIAKGIVQNEKLKLKRKSVDFVNKIADKVKNDTLYLDYSRIRDEIATNNVQKTQQTETHKPGRNRVVLLKNR